MLLVQGGRELLANKNDFTHILSIVCPDDTSIAEDPNHHVARMWDISEPLKGKFREYKAPDMITVLNALAWFDRVYINNSGNIKILVHCDMGVSRSSAMALGLLWSASSLYFRDVSELTRPGLLKSWLEARKDWCLGCVSEDCVGLRRFVEGRINPSVHPNQAVLKHLRKLLQDFPW